MTRGTKENTIALKGTTKGEKEMTIQKAIKKISGGFWTRDNELVEDIQDALNNDPNYLITVTYEDVTIEDTETQKYQTYSLWRAGRTISIGNRR